MPDYDTAKRIRELERMLPIEEHLQMLRLNRRKELKAMQVSNKALQAKLIEKNRLEINRATDKISLLKMELWDLQERGNLQKQSRQHAD